MRKTLIVTLGAVTAAVLAGASATASAASAYTCTGTLASGNYQKIVVPAGETCDGTSAVITVRGGVRVGEGATFVLGTEEGPFDTGRINGGLVADKPASLQVHFAHINGGLSMRGGEGFFSTIEDNAINGGATIDGYRAFWLGFIRNNVRGTVNFNNNVMDDPDANEIVTNTISGSLVCHGNSPAPQVGDSEGAPNVVSGKKVDQCAIL